jgi:hypothetical protein
VEQLSSSHHPGFLSRHHLFVQAKEYFSERFNHALGALKIP